jgi:ubiquinone/menaquinone biosynthesis C-methylase UbiE
VKRLVKRAYGTFKSALPARLREWLSAINQRWFARRTLRRKYGDWFDVEWRANYRSLSDREWKRAYDAVWEHHTNDCVEETDVRLVLEALGGPGSVLEAGCGQGSLAIALAKAGFQVTGMDVSARALALAAQRAGRDGVAIKLMEGFAERIPAPDKSFDHATCCHTLEHVKDLAAAAAELKRVARKKLVVIVPKQPYRRYAENYHTQYFERPEQLAEVFGLGRYQCRELDRSGNKGEFQGAVFLYVGFIG